MILKLFICEKENFWKNGKIEKSKTEKFITSFAKVYTPIVVTLAAILAILPPDLVEDCIAECKKTLAGNNEMSLADRIKYIVTTFGKIGVTKEMIEKRLGHTVESMNYDELTEYIGIFNGLKQKETTISDWFEQPKTASQMTELLMEEEKAKADKKGSDK